MNPGRFIAAVGVFDGVHAGHRHLLLQLVEAAHRFALTPMAITFSTHPLQLIAPHNAPLMLTSLQQRVELLRKSGAKQVEVLEFDNRLCRLSAREFLGMIHSRYAVDALLVGFNNHLGHDRITDIHTLQALGRDTGITVIGAEALRDGKISSSAVRSMLAEGQLRQATEALGRPYSVTGLVVAGRRLGHTIGYPTANLAPPHGIILPPDGVYAAMATTADGITSPAMVNIGTCPTIDHNHERTIEAHIIDRDCGNIYGTPLTLSFIDKIRDEKQFPSLEHLQQQLHADRLRVMELLHKSGTWERNKA